MESEIIEAICQCTDAQCYVDFAMQLAKSVIAPDGGVDYEDSGAQILLRKQSISFLNELHQHLNPTLHEEALQLLGKSAEI